MSKSMIDIAYSIVEEKSEALSFSGLLREVGDRLGLTDEEAIDRAGTFYTDLTMDGRFVILPNNFWDLKKRHCSADFHIDMNAVYSEVDEGDEEIGASELGEETEEEKTIDIETDDDSDDLDDKKPERRPEDIIQAISEE